MCLDLYSLDSQVSIPYASESVVFSDPMSYVAHYRFLVRNTGNRDIRKLQALYPRDLLQLVSETDVGTTIDLVGIHDDVHRIIAACDRSSGNGKPAPLTFNDGVLRLEMPSPNEPHTVWVFEGRFGLDQYQWVVPDELNLVQFDFLATIDRGFSPFHILLAELLKPGESQWVTLEIRVSNAGRELKDSLSGRKVFHSFASPAFVRRTLRDSCEVAIAAGDNDAKLLFDGFGLERVNDCSIGYFELEIWPGDPLKQELSDCFYEGDVWAKSRSPDIVTRGETTGPLYLWKSGCKLEQFSKHNAKGVQPEFRLMFAIRSDRN